MSQELLFAASEWAELREGFGLSLVCKRSTWFPVEALYQAELRWQLYRELPDWAADFELGERSNRCVFFEYLGTIDEGICADQDKFKAWFAPHFPH